MIRERFREDLLKKLGAENLLRIENTRVGLAGAGGLGSNCAANLARTGFKKLTIADFDLVEAANLDRQFYFSDQVGMRKVYALKANLLRINPDLELILFEGRIERANIKSVFADCDIVVECFDRAEYKSMLVSELLPEGKLIVAVSGVGGIGSSDEIKMHRIKSNLIVIGDLCSDIAEKPALAPRVSICAGKQADAALEAVIKQSIVQSTV